MKLARRAGLISWLSGHLNGVILQTFTKLLVERSSSTRRAGLTSARRASSSSQLHRVTGVLLTSTCSRHNNNQWRLRVSSPSFLGGGSASDKNWSKPGYLSVNSPDLFFELFFATYLRLALGLGLGLGLELVLMLMLMSKNKPKNKSGELTDKYPSRCSWRRRRSRYIWVTK